MIKHSFYNTPTPECQHSPTSLERHPIQKKGAADGQKLRFVPDNRRDGRFSRSNGLDDTFALPEQDHQGAATCQSSVAHSLVRSFTLSQARTSGNLEGLKDSERQVIFGRPALIDARVLPASVHHLLSLQAFCPACASSASLATGNSPRVRTLTVATDAHPALTSREAGKSPLNLSRNFSTLPRFSLPCVQPIGRVVL